MSYVRCPWTEGPSILGKVFGAIAAQFNKLGNWLFNRDPIAQMQYEYDKAVEQLKEGREGLEQYRGLVERVSRQVKDGEAQVTKLTAQAKTYLKMGDREKASMIAVQLTKAKNQLAETQGQLQKHEEAYNNNLKKIQFANKKLGELLPRGLPAAQVRAPSRRWVRREAVTTELLVLDGEGRPVDGARVYRYTDPSFYGVNQDASGARLFDTWRLLPMPFSAQTASELVLAHEDYWRGLDWAPVREVTPNVDAAHNPWIRHGALSTPAVELVAVTDTLGRARVLSGIFNLRDERRFPRAVVPEAIRLGFVVVADGFSAATTEKRFTKGGVSESRTLQLLEGPHQARPPRPRLADDHGHEEPLSGRNT